MAINDALLSLTKRETKYLKNSWAETFSKKIFPLLTRRAEYHGLARGYLQMKTDLEYYIVITMQ